ncbi:MAG: hypothetical protein IPK80_29965 [Nannocystis sp.]|nr:hypothetical protein [Nannocystis sp.]
MHSEPASEEVEVPERGAPWALWLPVIVAPVGLAVVILLSMMVSGWRVDQALIVQVEPRWLAGEELAIRVLHIDGERQPVAGTEVAVSVARGDVVAPLAALKDVGAAGVAQGRIVAPSLAPGFASLIVEAAAPGKPALQETIPIEVVATRPPLAGALTISQSTLNWGDNTEPQPEGLRVVLRPDRRLLAGFDNTLRVRVTDPEGTPLARKIEVALLSGELLGARGSSSAPPIIAEGSTDALGIFAIHGPLSSEVIELEVRVLAAEPGTEGAPTLAGKRRFRMVSFAGGVQLEGEPLAVALGEPVSLAARGLRTNRPIFVDLHAADGAWIDTLTPFLGREPPRSWSTTGLRPGVVQAEGYYFTNDPGESTALIRFYVSESALSGRETLAPLIAAHREVIGEVRVEKSFDRALEGRYLDYLGSATLPPEAVTSARAWLLSTLPVRIYGPPTVASTLLRSQEQLVALKLRWYGWLRVLLLGGGGAFLLVMSALLVRRHGRTARDTARALGDTAIVEAAAIRQAQRGAIVRALAVVVTMALGLVLTAVVLERLIWRV